MLNFYLKNLLFFFWFSSFAFSIQHPVNSHLKQKLASASIYEPNVYFLVFDERLILIGALHNANNLSKILSITKTFGKSLHSKNQVLNFLIYKKGASNSSLVSSIKRKLSYEKSIFISNYQFFSMGRCVWVVGYARTHYEKTCFINFLKNLKKRGEVDDFYFWIRYVPSSASGFVARV